MIVVYPLLAQNDYTELLFSIRSLEKNLQQIDEIIIVSDDLPDWITNITWLNIPEIKTSKQLSVKRKILTALDYCKKDVLFMNDDFYQLKPITDSYPYYTNGNLKSVHYGGSKELQSELTAMGKPTHSFEVHYPILFKTDFVNVINNFSPHTLIRSAYCNYLDIRGESIQDCKFINNPKPDKLASMLSLPCISTGTYSLAGLLHTLRELFPMKSNYEL